MQSLRDRLRAPRSIVRLGTYGLASLLVVSLVAVGQDAGTKGDSQTAPKQQSREQKIDEIVKQLEALTKEVAKLREETGTTLVPGSGVPATAPEDSLPAEWVKSLKWRSVGPSGMGGRITAISVFEADPCLWWVATASGGLLKTENNGVTFTHQFDREATVSIGDVCVAPSDKNIVWIGTGESNPRNSVSYGDGVYKSNDGGATWTNVGLRKSYQIGRVVVHPTNPDIVYVGALGRLYGPNEERGLYKTTDAGKTWQKILYVDDKSGVIDIAMHPTEPETLIVATWELQRDGFDSWFGDLPDGYVNYDPVKKWGPGSGLYKTTDGGKTWKKLNGSAASGLPTNHLGRMDVDYYRKNPNILYAIIDCEKIGMGTPPSRVYIGVRGEDVPNSGGARLRQITERSPAAKAGLKQGDVVRSVAFSPAKEGEAGEKKPVPSYTALTELLRGRSAGDKIALEVVRDDKTETIEVVLEDRPLGARAGFGRSGFGPGGAYVGLQGEDAETGVRLTAVVEDGPADKAGLRAGDIIRSANTDPITSYEQVIELVRSRQAGDRITFEILRDEKAIEIHVTLEDRPSGFGFGGGGGFGSLSGQLAQLLGATGEDGEAGVRVTRVLDDRAADKAGIEEGDIITEADGTAIPNAQTLVDLLRDKKEGDRITLKVLRGEEGKKEPQELPVTLEAPGGGSRTRPYAFALGGQAANVQDQQGPSSHEYGGVYKSTDGGETWKRINSVNPRPMYFSQIRVDPSDDKNLYVLGVQLHRSRDGGKTFTADGGRGVHADQHALWIDPRDGRHMIVGCDGGFYMTWDRMERWEHLNQLAIAQFYHVALDSRQPYRAYGGLQDNGSWGGPSIALSGGGPITEDWFSVGGGDGFVCRVDPFDPDIVYFESQDGNIGRRNLRTGERASIRPRTSMRTQPGATSTRGAEGQTGSQAQTAGRQAAAPRTRYRFNWNTPFILSSHNPGIFYCAGNCVFRSVKRGDDLKIISPDITRTARGSATALAESPRNSDVLWVGTDDGNLFVTRDGGANWTNVADNVGLPGPRWVATIEPSLAVEGRCYVAFDAHRSDDDEPYVFATEDFGQTWRSIRANLPWGSTRCLREDPKNPNLLFCGTEFACWASIDRGQYWTKLNNNLPTVAIHELAIHPTAGEMVAATHGRSLWVLDITPLRQITPQIVKADAHLYEPNTVVRWRSEPSRGISGGTKHFRGENPARGAQIFYSFTKKPQQLALKVLDYTGATIRELPTKSDLGLNVVAWDLTRLGDRPSSPAGGSSASTAGGRQGGRAQLVPPGLYRVVLTVDGKDFAQTVRIESDPALPNGVIAVQADPDFHEDEIERATETIIIDD